jgi:hypothetical protein
MCELPRADQKLAAFVDTCMQTSMPFAEAVAQLAPGFAVEGSAETQKAQLLCLRGLLGCGILVHCLTLRHRVEYGINFKCASLTAGPLLPQAAPICVVARCCILRGLL